MLDILRGVAVMGILTMNIVAFALPQAAYFDPRAIGVGSALDLGAWAFNFVLFEGKMRGLFSLLFGASMLLVIERAIDRGEAEARIHFARMGWLLLFGLLHLFLVWEGDILTLYALVGMIAFAFRDAPVRTLLHWAAGLLIVQFLVFALGSLGIMLMREPIDTLGLGGVAGELALYRGPYGGVVAHRLTNDLFDPVSALLDYGWETLAYMLIGMAAYRSGFANGAWSDRAYLRTVAIGFGVGLPAYALLAWLALRSDFHPAAVSLIHFPASVPLRPLVVAAIAAALILASRRGGALFARVAAVGRAAFSNYLGTSLVMTGLFYGWGLGWYGTLSRVELWPVVLAAWALMLLWSKPWLDRFRYGPFEWLWRSLARGRVEPLLR